MRKRAARQKGAVHPVMGLVMGAIVVFIGIFTVMQVINSVDLRSLTATKTNDSVTFTANDTWTALPSIPTYGVVTSLTGLANTSMSIALSNITYDVPTIGDASTSRVKLQVGPNVSSSKTYNVTYTYKYPPTSQSQSSYATMQTTFWNSIQLAAVSLITLAASLVLGSFFFK